MNVNSGTFTFLQEDYRKITVDKHAVTNFFKAEDIKACMKKVRTVNLHEVVHVDDELQIKCYYAGHVLGAAMFEIRVGQQSVVYTVSFHINLTTFDEVRLQSLFLKREIIT